MVSDAWAQVRDGVAGFFARRGRGDSDAEELAESRHELITARDEDDGQAEADIQALWRARLRRALLSDPAAAEELRGLLVEWGAVAGRSEGVEVRNVVSGGTQHGPVVQGRDMSQLSFRMDLPNQPDQDEN